jgi:hypothetical protein
MWRKGGNFMRYPISVGIAAGIIWGGLWQLCAWFQFTSPAEIDWWWAWGLMIGISIALAIFIQLMPNVQFMFVRAFMLAIIYWLLVSWSNPSLLAGGSFAHDPWQTWLTDACLTIQWLIFIDTSIQWSKNQDILNVQNL